MALDLQQPLSWFAGKPLPGRRPAQHGHRRDHLGLCPFGAETIHWIVSLPPSPRDEAEIGRVVLQADPLKMGGLPVRR